MYHPLTQPLVAPMVTGVAPRQGWQGIIKRQRVGLLRDVSESMSEDAKAADASRACSVLVQTLADPVNKDGFDVGVVDFTTTARCLQILKIWLKMRM